MRYDLHTHTNCSDGTKSPFEVIDLAKEKGLAGISITDHDTMSAYSPAIIDYAKKVGIYLLPGVEVSSRLHKQDVHILGYHIDPQDLRFQSFLKEVQKKREERNRLILEKLKELNVLITLEELKEEAKGEVIGRPHMASLLLKKGYVSSFQDAFYHYLGEGGSAYAVSPRFSPMEVIEEIHLAEGKAIIAHPFFVKREKVMNQLLEMPFDGIEARYAKMPSFEEEKWVKIAEEKNWIITGGSDFHGEIKPLNELGSSWVTHDTIQKLIS